MQRAPACSDQFFSDLHTFRQVNRDACVHSQQAGLSEEDLSRQPLSIKKKDPQHTMGIHQCMSTFCYRINSRLFPTLLDSQESYPVCKKPKSQIPHTAAETVFIRLVQHSPKHWAPAQQPGSEELCGHDGSIPGFPSAQEQLDPCVQSVWQPALDRYCLQGLPPISKPHSPSNPVF
ncbi:unnamed protein product [Coregonus sp. 'balchen']|nr:unnamed protein product [Coregonus sp. 'balchen']